MQVAYAIQCMETVKFYDPYEFEDDPNKRFPTLISGRSWAEALVEKLNSDVRELWDDIENHHQYRVVAVQFSIQEVPND